MYRPKAFQEDDVEKLIELMRSHSFPTLVAIDDGISRTAKISQFNNTFIIIKVGTLK